ncbi:cytochrome oxidase biogenesis protein Surf1, facilitates heme A insertion [Rothia nasimurium]|uniref:SURF1-like protein n=1 Tax=Rothia nasimurium TaxID=85336 RepID=A0A1Y1RQE8_9MICC|nr:SURF1 family protein [Rothia nasimurium]ORC21953.1 cytochrome oxidase biogenesis protein Surf1, facilitates heme A insertion [Rothia nasimurium]
MKKYGFLLSGKWVGLFVLTVVASLVCLYLANWQMSRKEALDFSNERISQNYDAAPLALSQQPHLFASSNPELRWQPVTMTGTYLPEYQYLVRNRPSKGVNGYEVLVPFRTVDGPLVVIDRGWVEAAFGDAGATAQSVPAPPSGEVTVTARVVEGEIDTGGSPIAGQLTSIDLAEMAQLTGLPLDTANYGVLASEDPAPASAPVAQEKPEEDYGPNLSYSVQWYCFALMFYIAFFWSARQKVRNDELDAQVIAELEAYYSQFYDEAGNYIGEEDEEIIRRRMEFVDDMPAHMKSIVRPKVSRRGARVTDEEEEDAIVDGLL